MLVVLDRIKKRHPDITNEEVVSAWESRIKTQFRVDEDKPYLISVGVSNTGKVLEMIAFEDESDVVIFHAMTPPSKKFLKEIGML